MTTTTVPGATSTIRQVQEDEDEEDTLLEKMLKDAQELAWKMSQKQQQQQQQGQSSSARIGTDVGSSSGLQSGDDNDDDEDKNDQGKNRTTIGPVKAATMPPPAPPQDLEDLLRQSEELLQKMRSATVRKPNHVDVYNDNGNNADDDCATPTVRTPSAAGDGDGAGPPSPSTVRPPMYSPPAPRSVYVVHHDDSLINESDELSSIESSSLLLSPTTRRQQSRIASSRSTASSNRATAAFAIGTQRSKNNGTDDKDECNDEDEDGDVDGASDSVDSTEAIHAMASLLPPLSREAVATNTDTRHLLGSRSLPHTTQGSPPSLISDHTDGPKPALVTPVATASPPLLSAAISHANGSATSPPVVVSSILDFKTASPQQEAAPATTARAATTAWEKVDSAQHGDDDYVPIVDYTTDATPKIRNHSNTNSHPNNSRSLLAFNGKRDDDDDEEDEDDYDDLTDSYEGDGDRNIGGRFSIGFSMRVEAYRKQQKKNRKKRMRRLLRSIAIGGISLAGLRYWYSSSVRNTDSGRTLADNPSTASLLQGDVKVRKLPEMRRGVQQRKKIYQRGKSTTGRTTHDFIKESSSRTASIASPSSLSPGTSSNALIHFLSSRADESSGGEFGDSVDNMAKLWTENPLFVKILDDFEKQIINKLQRPNPSEAEDTNDKDTTIEDVHAKAVPAMKITPPSPSPSEKKDKSAEEKAQDNVAESKAGQHAALTRERGVGQSFFKVRIEEVEAMVWI